MKSSFTSPLIAKHFFPNTMAHPSPAEPSYKPGQPTPPAFPSHPNAPHSTPTVLSGSSSPTPHINLALTPPPALTPGHKGGVQLLVSMGKPGCCFVTFRATAIPPGLHIKAILSGKTQVCLQRHFLS